MRHLLLSGFVIFGIALTSGCGNPNVEPAQDAGMPPSNLDAGRLDPGSGNAGMVDAGNGDPGMDAGTDDGGADAGADMDGGSDLPPETVILAAPSGTVATSTAEIRFASDDANASFECQLDGSAFAPCTSPTSYVGLSDGLHAFAVRARSATGIEDPSPAEVTWSIDTQPPDTTITSSPPAISASATATFTFSASEPDSTFECALDTTVFTSCTSPFSASQLAPGAHSFAVRAIDAVGHVDASPASFSWTISQQLQQRIRVMAANLTSGNFQSYDPGHGIRIFQGLAPDIVLIQEFNYGTNSAADLRAFVDNTFGPQFQYARETGAQIPNGVISRYPILASGIWEDPQAPNREFVWARIDVPGTKDLWAVSMHLLTSSASIRNQEAQALVTAISAAVPAGDYLVIGGDFNTATRTEPCITTLSQVVVTTASNGRYPADQNGNPETNASRTKPYDWVLADADLDPLMTAVEIGSSTFPAGLVFDSRVYSPLSEVSPVLSTDSGAANMQHMAVVKDFLIPY